ncbi:hypothetical protein C9374_013514 [Naegleria lovaniensis]|uniref:HTH myb-type domain-containing protein n=1 Tax=Naegleria lovaniensis TaxID=51637 RepID=A0AA88H1K1_NAELO|nr:uncharacterized protein C9374_013514 [Naegleria lovaniensis]KAG2392029.1 hypothetical protein C9374_013514 [Naegleria lovaniensis]
MVGATSLRPKRLVWTPSLHDLFVKAVEKLGLYEARPKEILQLMNVDNVTTTHIKSHLQKYRSQFKKGNQNVAPSNSSANLSAHEENSADMAGDDEIVEKARLSPKFPIKSEQISTTSSHSSSSTSSPGHHPSTTTNLHNTPHSTQQPNDSIFDNYNDFFPLLGQQQVSYLKDLLSSVHVNGHPINTMTTTSATNHVTPPPPSNTTNSITVNVQPPPPLQYGSSSGVNTSGVSAQNTNSIPNVHIIQVNNNAPQPPIGFNAVLDQNGNVNTSFNPMTSHCDTETLNDYLGVLKQICKSEHDIYHIFEKIQAEIREQRDLNFIVEGFRLGFLCGIRFHNNFSSNNPQNTSSEQPPTSSSSSPSTNRSPCRHQ